MATHPSFIISETDVPEELDAYRGDPELLGHSRPLGKAAGLTRLGMHVIRVPAGRRISWPHAEEKEEEFVYVLDGEVNAWIDGEIFPMKAGDFAAFPAGTGIAHTFINDSDREAKLFVGGEATKPDNRIVYPMHPQERDRRGDHWWTDAPKRPLGPHDGKPRAR